MDSVKMQQLEGRLRDWGNFRDKELRNGLGYPSQSAFCNLSGLAGSRGYESESLIYPEIEQTDRIIKDLGLFDPFMEKIIRSKYCPETKGDGKRFNDYEIYTKLRVFKATYYRHLNAAKFWMLGALAQLSKI